MSTTWEQFEGAALSLVRSGAIKDRLAEAYRNHLAQVNAEELPEGLRAEFRACHAALTRERPLRGEDAVRATVRKMSNEEADAVACTVVRLFAAMLRHSSREALAAHAERAAHGERAETSIKEPVIKSAAGASVSRHKPLKAVPQVTQVPSVPQVIARHAAEA
jgi:hypothetical protein